MIIDFQAVSIVRKSKRKLKPNRKWTPDVDETTNKTTKKTETNSSCSSKGTSIYIFFRVEQVWIAAQFCHRSLFPYLYLNHVQQRIFLVLLIWKEWDMITLSDFKLQLKLLSYFEENHDKLNLCFELVNSPTRFSEQIVLERI